MRAATSSFAANIESASKSPTETRNLRAALGNLCARGVRWSDQHARRVGLGGRVAAL